MAETIYDSYFRPWGQKIKADNGKFIQNCGLSSTKIDTGALDLSQKQSNAMSTCHRAKSIKNETVAVEKSQSDSSRSTPQTEAVTWNPLYYPNPLLIQQIQAYYHFLNSFPLLQQQQMQLLEENAIKQQHQTSSPLLSESTSFQSYAKDLKMDSIHTRGILNIPSPTFSHSHHKLNVEDKNIENDVTTTSQQYPLPTATDGEPLDLLPKSLYMNKAHGGHLCIFCGKLYSRKYGLKIHLRTHTGYKPLKCKVCQRPFGDPSNLNKHIRLHAEGDTPYRCEYCGKVLVRRRDLERHIRSRHPNKVEDLMQLDIPSSKSEEESDSDLEIAEELDVVG